MKYRIPLFMSIVMAMLANAASAQTPAPSTNTSVPSDLVPVGHTAFLVGHARGSQNYVCLPNAAGGFSWTLFGPHATLFDDDGEQRITHFLSANPVEGGTLRAT